MVRNHTWKIGLETRKECIGIPFLNKSMEFFWPFQIYQPIQNAQRALENIWISVIFVVGSWRFLKKSLADLFWAARVSVDVKLETLHAPKFNRFFLIEYFGNSDKSWFCPINPTFWFDWADYSNTYIYIC